MLLSNHMSCYSLCAHPHLSHVGFPVFQIYQVEPCLRALALAVPSAGNTVLSDSLLDKSFKLLPKLYLPYETKPDHLIKYNFTLPNFVFFYGTFHLFKPTLLIHYVY